YWLVASDGGIFSFGDAAFLGSTGATPLNRPIVGLAATPTGHGYWLVASDRGIVSFGDAAFLGSTGATPLHRPILGLAPPPHPHGPRLLAGGLRRGHLQLRRRRLLGIHRRQPPQPPHRGPGQLTHAQPVSVSWTRAHMRRRSTLRVRMRDTCIWLIPAVSRS